MSDDLVKRLREEIVLERLSFGCVSMRRNPDGPEAADRIEELQSNMKEAMDHAVKGWKENGMKTDDQLGVVALILAHGLGLTEKKDG